jgi:hypothetical protein
MTYDLNEDEIKLIEQLRKVLFGDALIKKQDGKIMYVDITDRTKYN